MMKKILIITALVGMTLMFFMMSEQVEKTKAPEVTEAVELRQPVGSSEPQQPLYTEVENVNTGLGGNPEDWKIRTDVTPEELARIEDETMSFFWEGSEVIKCRLTGKKLHDCELSDAAMAARQKLPETTILPTENEEETSN